MAIIYKIASWLTDWLISAQPEPHWKGKYGTVISYPLRNAFWKFYSNGGGGEMGLQPFPETIDVFEVLQGMRVVDTIGQ